jgi:hypothetical protein
MKDGYQKTHWPEPYRKKREGNIILKGIGCLVGAALGFLIGVLCVYGVFLYMIAQVMSGGGN